MDGERQGRPVSATGQYIILQPLIYFILSDTFLASCHPPVYNNHKHTGCPAVDRTTLIAHISLMVGPIIKPFDSMKVKTGRLFLVLLAILPYFRYENVFDKVLPEMVSVCPHRIKTKLCFELE